MLSRRLTAPAQRRPGKAGATEVDCQNLAVGDHLFRTVYGLLPGLERGVGQAYAQGDGASLSRHTPHAGVGDGGHARCHAKSGGEPDEGLIVLLLAHRHEPSPLSPAPRMA